VLSIVLNLPEKTPPISPLKVIKAGYNAKTHENLTKRLLKFEIILPEKIPNELKANANMLWRKTFRKDFKENNRTIAPKCNASQTSLKLENQFK